MAHERLHCRKQADRANPHQIRRHEPAQPQQRADVAIGQGQDAGSWKNVAKQKTRDERIAPPGCGRPDPQQYEQHVPYELFWQVHELSERGELPRRGRGYEAQRCAGYVTCALTCIERRNMPWSGAHS